MLARGHSGGGIHYLPELQRSQYLIPHVESRRDGGVPGSAPVGKSPDRSAKLKLHSYFFL
jgi:hypothetical protein